MNTPDKDWDFGFKHDHSSARCTAPGGKMSLTENKEMTTHQTKSGQPFPLTKNLLIGPGSQIQESPGPTQELKWISGPVKIAL
jgi:hypothetical protein